jgi:hypothetical protein
MSRKQKKSKIRILVVFLVLLGVWCTLRLGYNAPLVFDENTQIEIGE